MSGQELMEDEFVQFGRHPHSDQKKPQKEREVSMPRSGSVGISPYSKRFGGEFNRAAGLLVFELFSKVVDGES
jgi:hypothetical protein